MELVKEVVKTHNPPPSPPNPPLPLDPPLAGTFEKAVWESVVSVVFFFYAYLNTIRTIDSNKCILRRFTTKMYQA